MADPLPADLARALAAADTPVARADVRYFADLDSTNDVALALAEAGAVDGTAVLADQQRRGRGRRGRSWYSPPGAGLYLSRVVRPAGPAAAVGLVTLGAGVAAARAIEDATGLSPELKWPNDLVCGRPWRKLGGVLCEAVAAGRRVDAVIVGIGLNLRPAAYPGAIADRATSIETELGRSIERAPLVVALLTRLAEVVTAIDAGDGAGVRRAWRRFGAAGLDGASVRWEDAGRMCAGLARDIDRDGALVVERDGRTERLIAGEVTWERLSHARS